jgi:hypothetical protein
LFVFGLGAFWTPAFLNHEKISEIYLLDAKSEVRPTPIRGKVLFSLTKYLIVLRDDDVFVAVATSRVERIETPKDQPAKPAVTPSATPGASASPAPTSKATPPTPSATPATPSASPSVSTSQKPQNEP